MSHLLTLRLISRHLPILILPYPFNFSPQVQCRFDLHTIWLVGGVATDQVVRDGFINHSLLVIGGRVFDVEMSAHRCALIWFHPFEFFSAGAMCLNVHTVRLVGGAEATR